MKNSVTIGMLLLSGFVFSQDHERNQIVNTIEHMARNKHSIYSPKNTMGSPYINDKFLPATISNVTQSAMMRYDGYNDEFEFIDTTSDTLVLHKSDKFNTISFKVGSAKYKLVEYSKKDTNVTGYLQWVAEKNNVTLYKRQSVEYIAERKATTSFEVNQPAKFERHKDVYYFKHGDNAVAEFPTNRKGLLKLYPDRKSELETFIKENKIDFDQETDLVKLIGFLAV
ncbi:hypothetical protein [Flavobacterium sp.]